MISIYKIKPQFQKLLTPVLEFLHRKHITANQITITASVFSFLIALLFWFADTNRLFFLALPVGLLIRMALNALDGMMARRYNQISKKGELLNELGDVISDTILFFPLLKFLPNQSYLVVLFIVLSVINEYAGVMGKLISGERRYDGPMGKSDRALVLAVFGVLSLLNIDSSSYASYALSIIILLLLLSTSLRIKNSFANDE